jgi:hypothetical protein
MMKKTLLIAAASTLLLSISSVCSAGNIEKAERYAAPLNVVEMDMSANTGQEIASKELGFGLGSNAEVQVRAFDGDVKFMSNPEVQELGGLFGGWCLDWPHCFDGF